MGTITLPFLLLLLVLGGSIFSIARNKISVPIIIAMCFFPADVSIKLGTIDLQALRVITILCFIRVVSTIKKEIVPFNTIDKLFYAYQITGFLGYIIASGITTSSIIFRTGLLIDYTFLFYIFRQTIQDTQAIKLIVKTLTYCVLLLLPVIIFEYYFTENILSFLGRSRIEVRQGEIRAAGAFSHSILFGSFAAAIFPFLWGAYKEKKDRLYLTGIGCCFFYVVASSSSGPIMATVAAIFFLFFFVFKQYSASLWHGIIALSIVVHFIREAPLWHTIYARFSIKSSSTGYYRYQLVEAAIAELNKWWGIGYGEKGPDWHITYWPWSNYTFTDVTNHYLLEGVRGGLLPMFIFIFLCYKTVKTLGAYAIACKDNTDQWLWWGVTVMLLTHCVSFLSVAYFGQIIALFILTVALGAYVIDSQAITQKKRYLKKSQEQ